MQLWSNENHANLMEMFSNTNGISNLEESANQEMSQISEDPPSKFPQ